MAMNKTEYNRQDEWIYHTRLVLIWCLIVVLMVVCILIFGPLHFVFFTNRGKNKNVVLDMVLDTDAADL